MHARRRHHRGQGLRPARPRWRRLPHRHEVGLHPAGQPQAEVPRRQRRRVRAGHLQGHPAHDGQPAHPGRGRHHQLLRHPRQHRLHLRARRGPARRPPPAARGPGGLPRRAPRQGHPRLGLRPRPHRARRCRRLHLWRGDRPARGPRGPSRPAAPAPAVPRRGRPLRQPDGHQQRRVDRVGAEHHRPTAPPGSPRWAPRSPRATASSACRATSPARASTRRRWASPCAS